MPVFRLSLTALILAIASVIALAAWGDDGGHKQTTTPAASPVSTETVGTPFSPPQAEPTPRAEVTGLFTEPREAPQTVSRPLGPRPASTFMSWDGNTTVL